MRSISSAFPQMSPYAIALLILVFSLEEFTILTKCSVTLIPVNAAFTEPITRARHRAIRNHPPSDTHATWSRSTPSLKNSAHNQHGSSGDNTSTTLSTNEHGISIAAPTRFLDSHTSLLHSIHVEPLLSSSETEQTLSLARDYAESTGCWDETSDRHVSYNTVDFEVEDCPPLQKYLDSVRFQDRILDRMSETYNIPKRFMSYLDFFCVHYSTSEEGAGLASLPNHRDGSLLSFSVLLSDPKKDFTGGGTFFECLQNETLPEHELLLPSVNPGDRNGVICPSEAGLLVSHSGKMLHGGNGITSGERTILVGFVDVDTRIWNTDRLAIACKNWGRMDVAKYWAKRQDLMTTDDNNDKKKKGWVIKNKRWLPWKGGAGRSYLTGFIPAFQSVQRRAGEGFQLLQRLSAEEEFLEFALIPEDQTDVQEEIYGVEEMFGADITVL